MIRLTGREDEVDLGRGVRLSAPGLQGVADHGAVVPVTASGQLFAHAVANSGLVGGEPIRLTHTTAPDHALQITVPAPTDDSHHALLLVHDSSGVVSWHQPLQRTVASNRFLDRASTIAPGTPDTVGAELSFSIPAGRFAVPSGSDGRLASDIANLLHHFQFHLGESGIQKTLTVFEYPIAHLAELGATKWIDWWDHNKHPTTIRWFPAKAGQSAGEPLSPTNWADLHADNGPVLLFVHGIFSKCGDAFADLIKDQPTVEAIGNLYPGGRIIGFDHPTVAVDPAQNALDFLDQIPTGITLDVDIVCHSRGGLVARALAGQTELTRAAGGKVQVRKIIFAATPNGGSQITVGATWARVIDRICSLLTLPSTLLPVPVDEVTSILAGVLELIKVIGVGAAVQLPGLEAMIPDSELIKDLATYRGPVPDYFAAASDFEPGRLLPTLFHGLDDAGRAVDDIVFPHVHNDIAVPTNGVWDPANPNSLEPPPDDLVFAGFPIPDDHRYSIGPGDTYWHSKYFADQTLRRTLVAWLAAPLAHDPANGFSGTA